MQVSVETTSGLERRVTLGVDAKEIDGEINKRLQHLARTQKMNGFRPGKVPVKFIQKRFGSAVRQEVTQEIMQRNFFQAIQQEKINPAGYPRFEEVTNEAGKDLEFAAIFEVYPEIKVNDCTKLKIEKASAEVTDKDLDNMLNTLQKQKGEWKKVRRKPRKEDQVIIDFVGSVDGEEFEGGKGENHPLVLGSNTMIPGFEDQLIGAKKGEEIDVTVTFPETYQVEALRNKEAVFKVTVNDVLGLALPDLTDEFATDFGQESVDDLKAEVRKNMERELKNVLRQKNKSAVLDALREANEVDIPSAMLTQEVDAMRRQAQQQFAQGGDVSKLPELPASMFEEQAKKRVALGLLVGEIIKSEEIEVDGEKVREAVDELASAYEEPTEVVNWYYNNENQLKEVEAMVLEDQVVDSILSKAKVKEVKTAFDKVMNQK
jgi:trigger factor